MPCQTLLHIQSAKNFPAFGYYRSYSHPRTSVRLLHFCPKYRIKPLVLRLRLSSVADHACAWELCHNDEISPPSDYYDSSKLWPCHPDNSYNYKGRGPIQLTLYIFKLNTLLNLSDTMLTLWVGSAGKMLGKLLNPYVT